MIMFSFDKKEGHAFGDVNVLVFYTLTSMWFNTAICINTTSYSNAFNATSVNFIKGKRFNLMKFLSDICD